MSQQSHRTVTLLSSPQHSACLEQQSSLWACRRQDIKEGTEQAKVYTSQTVTVIWFVLVRHSIHHSWYSFPTWKRNSNKKKRIKNIKLIITLPLILNIYVLFASLHKTWAVCVTIWLTKQGLLSHFSHTTLCLLDSYLIHSNHVAWEKCKRGHIHINP